MRIGTTPKNQQAGLMGALSECHERIRRFAELARRLGEERALTSPEVSDAASAVRRYFEEALPLHVQDEEQSIVPRLLGRDGALDAALEQMVREHRTHEEPLRELIGICKTLEAKPDQHPTLRARLAELAAALASDFEAHLRHEEAIILPAIERYLEAGEQTEMLAELRQRRG